MQITEEQILKIVDKCFHSYASSFRNEAREEAITLINKHQEAIIVTHCCTELKDTKALNYVDWKKREGLERFEDLVYKKGNTLIAVDDVLSTYDSYYDSF